MKDAQKPDHISLTTLVGRLREGRFVIPDFQREFEWKPWDIRELARSIFLDYYIGSLLLWKGKSENFEALACEPIYGYGGEGDPAHIVLDGQQRLTAMHYVFLSPDKPLPNRLNRFLYFIRVDRFMEEAYEEAFTYDWTLRGTKLLTDQDLQFETHHFPISIIGKSGWALADWVRNYEEHWRQKMEDAREKRNDDAAQAADLRARDAHKFGKHLKSITEQYQISYIELDRDLEIDKVCDIFTQINSRGIGLDVFDLFNAMLKPKGLQLKLLWREAAQRLEFFKMDSMNIYLLQVMSIVRQAYCSPKYLYYLLPGQEKKVRKSDGSLRKEILVPDVADFERRWNKAVDAVENAIKLLRHPQEFGAISLKYLPYLSILPAFAALETTARVLPAPRQLDARRKLRLWYWASIFTNRYSGSVESTSARDYLDVRAWFDDDDAKPDLIAEFRASFKNLEFRQETKRISSVYKGIFNLLVLNGARDWMTGNVPQYDDLDDHHIVPKSWGKEAGLHGNIDTILNRTPLTVDTNRRIIRDRLPNEYLPELIKESDKAGVQDILETHFISSNALAILLRNPFTTDDFEAFLAERQRTLQEAIENLLIKERLDLSPQLRKLDERIEMVELTLRQGIDTALGGDPAKLPSHVHQKIEERLRKDAKKSAAFDNNRYETLSGKLEYADLRELQDTIMNKELWWLFEKHYMNKETLGTRFGQLADLRNAIRHSRNVEQITRMDGEASILWFEKANRQ